jgi:uncharacterized membrane protein YadS
VAFPLLAALTLLPVVSPGIALIAGICGRTHDRQPLSNHHGANDNPALQISVIGLGAGMNLIEVGRAGLHGFFYTIIGITLTISLGLLLGRLLKVKHR